MLMRIIYNSNQDGNGKRYIHNKNKDEKLMISNRPYTIATMHVLRRRMYVSKKKRKRKRKEK